MRLLLAILTVLTTRSEGALPRLGIRLQPLIGGPRFFRAHVVVTLTEERTDRQSEVAYLDYVPDDATDPATIVRLLMGRDVPGVVRQRVSDGFSSTALANELCVGFNATRLNLVRNNCYHFAWHCFQQYRIQ